MAIRTNRLVFLLINTLLFIYVNASTTCNQRSPCSCIYENEEKMINLESLSNETYISNFKDNLTFYFHPCKNVNIPIKDATNNDCKSTSVCVFNTTTPNATNATNLGSINEVKFTSTDKFKYNIVYSHNINNKTTTTVISLVCTDYTGRTDLVIAQTDATTNHLLLYSAAACLQDIRKQDGLSTGSVLVIMFLVFTSVYLLGGAAILHLLRGARGREMIPNIDFWRELPLLVKDGAVFLQNGCKPVISNSETYDRI